MEQLVLWMSLTGIRTNDFPEALQSWQGTNAKRLSASTVTRPKAAGKDEDTEWSKRSLEGKQ